MPSSSTLDEGTDLQESNRSYSSQASRQSCGLPSSYPADVSFDLLVNRILSDENVTDDALEQFALEHLAVLDDPAYQNDNVPQWVRRLRCREVRSFSVRRMFTAMSQTARRLGLPGTRYVNASVHACAVFASQEADSRDQPKRLAAELSKVANTWVAYMLWPCEWKRLYMRILADPDGLVVYPEQEEPAEWSNEGSDIATPTSNETSSISHRPNLRYSVRTVLLT